VKTTDQTEEIQKLKERLTFLQNPVSIDINDNEYIRLDTADINLALYGSEFDDY
jgi:hypothetical protein